MILSSLTILQDDVLLLGVFTCLNFLIASIISDEDSRFDFVFTIKKAFRLGLTVLGLFRVVVFKFVRVVEFCIVSICFESVVVPFCDFGSSSTLFETSLTVCWSIVGCCGGFITMDE